MDGGEGARVRRIGSAGIGQIDSRPEAASPRAC